MKILIDKEVLQQALDALEAVSYVIDPSRDPKEENLVMYALTALRTAPEPQTVEPVAWVTKHGLQLAQQHEDDVPLYTHPANDELREAAMAVCSEFLENTCIASKSISRLRKAL